MIPNLPLDCADFPGGLEGCVVVEGGGGGELVGEGVSVGG